MLDLSFSAAHPKDIFVVGYLLQNPRFPVVVASSTRSFCPIDFVNETKQRARTRLMLSCVRWQIVNKENQGASVN